MYYKKKHKCKCLVGIGTTLEYHPFSGLVDSAGGLLHTPKRILTSIATILLV